MVIANQNISKQVEIEVLRNREIYSENMKVTFRDLDVIAPYLGEELLWEGTICAIKGDSYGVTHVMLDGVEFPDCPYRVVWIGIENIVDLRKTEGEDSEDNTGLSVRSPRR